MKRRQFIQRSVASAAAIAPVFAESTSTSKPPNLVIVHCDELNFRVLGCYRDTLSPEQAFMWGDTTVVETPHIDQMANEGLLMTKMYAATPVCSPSRSSFISGRYPHNTPVVNNSVALSDDIVSFSAILGNAGYATGYAGKWHLDGLGKPQWAPERKFGFEDNRFMFNRGHWKQLEDGPDGPRVKARDHKGKPSYSVQGADEESFATDYLTNKTIDFIRANKDKPFAYMLSIPDPHGPDTVRAPYDSMYSDNAVEKPRTFDKPPKDVPSWAARAAKCNYHMASYYGMMKCIDDNVGKLRQALEEEGILDNTIFIFTADHGDMRGEHHRQNKGIPLEASAKIPFVVRWPAGFKPGSRIDHVFNTVDFLPTICSMMHIKTAGLEEGRNMQAVLQGAELPANDEDVTFMRSTGKGKGATAGWLAAVTPRYKLILSSQDPAWLLDLETDPDELINFAESKVHQHVARRLATSLKEYAERTGDPYIKNPRTAASLATILEV